MSNKAPPPDFDENPEWTAETDRRSASATEVHPAHVVSALVRPPQTDQEEVTLELDSDIVEKYRATGNGWQARINAVLRAADVPIDRPESNAA